MWYFTWPLQVFYGLSDLTIISHYACAFGFIPTVTRLFFRNPQVLCSGFDRPNLFFAVCLKGPIQGAFVDLQKYMVLKNGVWSFPGSTIIYCISRNITETIGKTLRCKYLKQLCWIERRKKKVRLSWIRACSVLELSARQLTGIVGTRTWVTCNGVRLIL